ncbi:lysozyme g-like [Ambystoma mexicanum]|uniref:lysozyme g-like n=1 Tax=Ambystoma mexicanum TaxID=8296 RepID=UPI0037E9560C
MFAALMCLCLAGSIGLSRGIPPCYGYVKGVATSGASCQTAKLHKLTYCGHIASLHIAESDYQRMAKYKVKIGIVAHNLCMDAAVIAAIISRESHAGANLINGEDPDKRLYGLMQLNKLWHPPLGAWDSEEHISQATEFLITMINTIKAKFPNWTVNQQLKGGIAAYNAGPANILSYADVDKHTSGHDYSNDVIARAIFFKAYGY